MARLKPPHWLALPAQRELGALYEKKPEAGAEAAKLHARITAHQLHALGITGNFTPVLDLYIHGATSAIGDRAISRKPDVIAAIGRVLIDTYLANGILPIAKHMPGHGRAVADPHATLPFVDTPYSLLEAEDFEPFRKLNDAPMGMNCHVVFKSIDASFPASLSRKMHESVIRGSIGFKGLIVSDDLAMKALGGPPAKRAQMALEAGSDILIYCSGGLSEMRRALGHKDNSFDFVANGLPEMREIADALTPMSNQTMQKLTQAMSRLGKPDQTYDAASDFQRFQALFHA